MANKKIEPRDKEDQPKPENPSSTQLPPEQPKLELNFPYINHRTITTQVKTLKRTGLPPEQVAQILGLTVIKTIYTIKNIQPNYQTQEGEAYKAEEVKSISKELDAVLEKISKKKKIKETISKLEKELYTSIEENGQPREEIEKPAERLYNSFLKNGQRESDWPPRSMKLYQNIGEKINKELSKDENKKNTKEFNKEVGEIDNKIFLLKQQKGKIKDEKFSAQYLKYKAEKDLLTGKRFYEEEKLLRAAVEAAILKYQRDKELEDKKLEQKK